MRKKMKSMFGLAIIVAFFMPGLIGAGDLEPTAPPGPTMKTLDDIYQKIESFQSTNGGSQSLPSRFDQQAVIHMEIEGVAQGKIEGICSVEGLEGTIPVVGLEQTIHIPTDQQSGQPTGKRVHSPISVVKYIDKASPKLYKALVTGEMLNVTLRWYGIDPAGATEHFFTVSLEDAIIVEVKSYFPNFEGVSFTYRKIVWSWEPDGTHSEDDWRAPVT